MDGISRSTRRLHPFFLISVSVVPKQLLVHGRFSMTVVSNEWYMNEHMDDCRHSGFIELNWKNLVSHLSVSYFSIISFVGNFTEIPMI